MDESTVGVLVPLLGIYVVSLLIFMRFGNIQDFLKEIRDTLKKEDSDAKT